ncbi:MAG: hypothetical protein JWQ14_2141 [Adhaeribacter sp.]|nr:hypothetical protein [Adhaeribacter sp.]
MRPYYLVYFILVSALFLNGCAQKLGARFTAGVKKELNKDYLDSTARTLTRGVLSTVLNDSIQSRLRAQLDSVGRQLDKQAVATSVHLRDSLLSAYTQLWLEKIIKNSTADLNAKGISFLDNIRGERTRLFVAALRDELLNDQTLQRAGIFRDELLGKATHVLLDSLAQQVASGLINNQLKPNTNKIINDLNRQAQARIKEVTRLAYLAGGVALFIGIVAFLIFRQARKHKETLKIITKQIDKIPDQVTYDKLVGSIRQEAETKGLEPHLQNILKEEKLYQQPQWQEKDYQALQFITHYLQSIENNEKGQEILQDLTAESKKVNLEAHLNSLLKRSGKVPEKV